MQISCARRSTTRCEDSPGHSCGIFRCAPCAECPPGSYLLKLSGMSKGNLSVQMNKLGSAKMVRIDKSFAGNRPRTMYELTAQGRKALRAYKKSMKMILAALPD